MKKLTPAQITVVQALAAGSTVTAAARLADVSRPTVYKWMEDPIFDQALGFAQQEHALTIRDRINTLTAKALDKIEEVLDNPNSSPSVILKASLAILNRKDWSLPCESFADTASHIYKAAERVHADPELAKDTGAYTTQLTEIYSDVEHRESVKQTPRNAACPCGSGKKYKRCCGEDAPPVLHRPAA